MSDDRPERGWRSRPEGRATINDAIRRQALRQPTKPAVVVHGSPSARVVTYAELDALAASFAQGLIDLGLSVGERIAMLASNRLEYLIVCLGALKAGVSFTGVNERSQPHELEWQLRHLDPAVIVVDEQHAGVLRAIASSLNNVRAYVVVGALEDDAPWHSYDQLMRCHVAAPEPDVAMDEDTIAFVSYTSGTEARPKGVVLPHRNYLISTMQSLVLDGYIGPTQRELVVKPFYTIAGFGSMTSLLLAGATIVMLNPWTLDSVLEAVASQRVTVLSQTPTFYLQLTRHPAFGQADLSSLEQCHVYGGLVSSSMLERFREVAPQVIWANYWGQSELTQLGTVGWFRTLADIPGGDPRWIGRPTAGLEIRVVGADGEAADVGELICRSPGLMRGYHRAPELTAKVIRDGWLHTGDIVRIDSQGNLFFVDRAKDVIKTGGLNVSSLEVEEALLAHPAILDAAVVGVSDEYWSEAVTAFVVTRPGDSADVEMLSGFCRDRLAHHKVPKRIHVVDMLPRDPQGKLRKAVLREEGARLASLGAAGSLGPPTSVPRRHVTYDV